MSPEQALALWRERQETVQAIREGLADFEARHFSAADVTALVNSCQPAPNDETVRLWIDEHRSKKYDG
jgi:hypothetical protein